MEEKRFTPGPWHWDEEGLGNKNIIVFGKEYPAEMTSKANKSLIAAAPELLEALQLFLDAQILPIYHQSIARAAIAKALGKE